MHERLLRAYFVESRDISAPEILRSLWRELDLAEDGFDAHRDPAIRREVLSEHAEAVELGATGVPAVRLAGNSAVIVGAQPVGQPSQLETCRPVIKDRRDGTHNGALQYAASKVAPCWASLSMFGV